MKVRHASEFLPPAVVQPAQVRQPLPNVVDIRPVVRIAPAYVAQPEPKDETTLTLFLSVGFVIFCFLVWGLLNSQKKESPPGPAPYSSTQQPVVDTAYSPPTAEVRLAVSLEQGHRTAIRDFQVDRYAIFAGEIVHLVGQTGNHFNIVVERGSKELELWAAASTLLEFTK